MFERACLGLRFEFQRGVSHFTRGGSIVCRYREDEAVVIESPFRLCTTTSRSLPWLQRNGGHADGDDCLEPVSCSPLDPRSRVSERSTLELPSSSMTACASKGAVQGALRACSTYPMASGVLVSDPAQLHSNGGRSKPSSSSSSSINALLSIKQITSSSSNLGLENPSFRPLHAPLKTPTIQSLPPLPSPSTPTRLNVSAVRSTTAGSTPTQSSENLTVFIHSLTSASE